MEKQEIENKNQSPKINIGIDAEGRKQICENLSRVLSDTFLMALKTQNYHWNVTGRMFKSLHVLFEEQYKDLYEAADLIAERMRALGEFAPGSFSAFSKQTAIKEETGIPSSDEMISNLIKGHETIVEALNEGIRKCDDVSDDATQDMLIARVQEHEKQAWMLRSLITPQESSVQNTDH